MFLPVTAGVIQLSPRPAISFSMALTASLRENGIHSKKRNLQSLGNKNSAVLTFKSILDSTAVVNIRGIKQDLIKENSRHLSPVLIRDIYIGNTN